MKLTLKSLWATTTGTFLSVCLLASPAYSQATNSLSNLNNSSNTLTTGDFEFSGFSIIDWPSNPNTSAQDYLDFGAFGITANLDGAGNPFLTFANSILMVSGNYTLDYQVDYTGAGSRNFINYAQGFCEPPFGCSGDTISTNIYETASDRTNGSGSLASVQTNIDQITSDENISKIGGIPTAYARTTINVSSGSFDGFNGTYKPVPIETDALPLVGSSVLFGGGLWLKRRRKASQLDLVAQTPESK